MSKRIFLSVAVITLLFSLTLFFFPQIDVAISQFFYRPTKGFLLEIYYYFFHLGMIRDILSWGTYLFIAVLVLMLIGGWIFKSVKMPISPRICGFLIVCFALAPGLAVNQVLKAHWGRARPNQTEIFGGTKNFTPAWVISNQCHSNCSFTSGETANVFCYMAIAFVVRRKRLAWISVLSIGLLTVFERVAQGDHFFSDAVLSGLLDYLIIWLTYYLFFEKTNLNKENATC